MGIHRQRKRGSYWTKHRNDVSRWWLCIMGNLERKRRHKSRERMYDTVEECMKNEKPKRKCTPVATDHPA